MRALAVLLLVSFPAFAADEKPAPRKLKDVEVTEANIRKAVETALPQLWKGIEGHSDVHTCFTCHNHGTTLVAFGAARSRGFDIPEKKLKEQIDGIVADLERNRERFEKGKGPGAPGGGETDNTGYALMALDAIGYKADKTTAMVIGYTLDHQKSREYWCTLTRRFPTEASSFTTTALNLRGIRAYRAYRNPEQTEIADKRIADAKQWLRMSEGKDTEDRTFRLVGNVRKRRSFRG